MTVYVDDAVTLWRGRRWAHLMADTLGELHAMAARLGDVGNPSSLHASGRAARRLAEAVLEAARA